MGTARSGRGSSLVPGLTPAAGVEQSPDGNRRALSPAQLPRVDSGSLALPGKGVPALVGVALKTLGLGHT